MPTKKGPKTVPVTVRLTPEIVGIVDSLIGTFGLSRSDAARYLLLTRIEQVIADELPRKLKEQGKKGR